MGPAITAIQIILSVALCALILIQSKGNGIGRAWGGGGGTSFTRRGLEKILFRFTFVISALFIGVSILQLII
jgi:protein translocase SecG subunit